MLLVIAMLPPFFVCVVCGLWIVCWFVYAHRGCLVFIDSVVSVYSSSLIGAIWYLLAVVSPCRRPNFLLSEKKVGKETDHRIDF